MKRVLSVGLLLIGCVTRTHNANVKVAGAETEFDRYLAGFLESIKADVDKRYPKMGVITCKDIAISNVKGNGELKIVAHATASCFIRYKSTGETRIINYKTNTVSKKLEVISEKVVKGDYEQQLIEENRSQAMGGDPMLYFIEEKAVTFQDRFADFANFLKILKVEPAEFEKIEFSILPGPYSQFCGMGIECWHIVGKDKNGKSIESYFGDGPQDKTEPIILLGKK